MSLKGRDARRQGSPYAKADLTLRGLARMLDFTLAIVVAHTAPDVGPQLAVFYLLVADGLMHEFLNRLRSAGVRTVTTGFFRPEYFYGYGFRIEKRYAGLVKDLSGDEFP